MQRNHETSLEDIPPSMPRLTLVGRERETGSGLDVEPLEHEAMGVSGDPIAAEPSPSQTPPIDSVIDRYMNALQARLRGKARTNEPSAPNEDLVETRLGSHHIERRIGAGGMGEVFAARHVQTQQAVALKTLSSTTGTRLYRFKREFRALADISHRNLIRLFELVVPEDGSPYFTMELVDGVSFVHWVRGSTPDGELPDLHRLADSLRQLVTGVCHLHSHGYIHRDIKPSNVLVTGEGRVVVLDFGLVSELSEPDKRITRDRQILGTPSYMAPEQARGERTGPAADYYAIGVMLFECLTGHRLHEGGLMKQLLAKQSFTIDPRGELAAVPKGLRDLCIGLLARDPGSRMGAREVLEYLRAPSASKAGPSMNFVGRRRELDELHAAFREVTERDRTVVVHLRGKSGHGKSALAHRFRSELRDTDAIVLRGRCRERETVPYKGVDAIVDSLSSHLRRLPPDERMELRPMDLSALVQVFPVLDEVWEPSKSPNLLGQSETRNLGGAVLRRLLHEIASKHPLVVYIDDFQWADLDSVNLLEFLAQSPQGPAMLLLLSYRSETEAPRVLRELMASKSLTARARMLEIEPLAESDARDLASSLLTTRDPGARGMQAEAIALRSRGIPFFITQMAMDVGQLDSQDADLNQIVAHRLETLGRDQRRLLELVATSGGPVSVELACDLVDVKETAVGSLCDLGLVVRDVYADDTPRRRVEVAHDRIREVILTQLDARDRVHLHWRIGESLLARDGGDPQGDAIFVVVDHLAAGVADFDALSPEHRLHLARLGYQAGQRAFESGAWVAAHRYFGLACSLLEPWLDEARRGGGEYPLCLAVVFGRIQVEFLLDMVVDVQIHEILSWSLTMEDYFRITEWYCETHLLKSRFAGSVNFGIQALQHLGFRVPTRPSWPRALLSFHRGWRAIWKTGLDQIHSMPQAADPRIQSGMEFLSLINGFAATVDIPLQLSLTGTYCQMITKHGLHARAPLGLAGLAIAAVALGKHREGRALVNLTETLLESPRASKTSVLIAKIVLMVATVALRPVHESLLPSEEIYEHSCDVAPRGVVEIAAVSRLYVLQLAGAPLPDVADFLGHFRENPKGFTFSFMEDFVSEFSLQIGALTKPTVLLDLCSDPGTTLDEILRGWVLIMRSMTAFLLGDQDGAWESIQKIPVEHQRILVTCWFSPVHAMMSVLLAAERWSTLSGRERRRMSRAIRKHRKTVARAARGCAETFQPMLDIVDGEIAALKSRYADAVTAYERARSVSSKSGIPWLRGLASERLGTLARRQGHSTVARAALTAACDAYEEWGATAVVHRLEQELAALYSGALRRDQQSSP